MESQQVQDALLQCFKQFVTLLLFTARGYRIQLIGVLLMEWCWGAVWHWKPGLINLLCTLF